MNPASTLSKPNWNPWPVAIVAYFIVFTTGMAIFITWSVRQRVDLVGADYYEQEMRFQQRIESLNRTGKLGAETGVALENGRIVVNLPALQARLHPEGTIHLYRPSDARMDRSLNLAVSQAGRQEIEVANLPPGLWKVRVAWKVRDEDFFKDETVVVPGAR